LKNTHLGLAALFAAAFLHVARAYRKRGGNRNERQSKNVSEGIAPRASLTYRPFMEIRPITVVETGMFLRQAEKIWSDEERAVLVDHVARNPEAGDVIPATGGVRKVRWGRAGSGKRGGARVVYFFYDVDLPLYLLLAYAKAQASDMSADEKKIVTSLVSVIKGLGKKEKKR
jgi:hypothetical protein